MRISARQRLALIGSLVAWSVSPAFAREVIAMSDEAFWTIIDTTAVQGGDQEAQLAALAQRLAALSPDEIVGFEVAFQRHINLAYTWDLWGAGYVAHGGMSDDGFEYFRRWLISKGRAVYESVLADPDDLANVISENTQEALEFEELAYVASEAWQLRTGGSLDTFWEASPPIFPDGAPQGEPFEEDETHLAARYPKLWRRFGDNPLM